MDISWKSDTGDFYESLSSNSQLGYREKNMGHFTWIPQYVLLLLAALNGHKRIVVQHSVFYIVDSDV